MPAEELGVSISIEPSAASVEMGCARAHRGMTGRTTPLYVVCSPCRGVGKTLVSRLLIEFHAIDDRPVAAFDLADEGPQLADFLPQFTTVVDLGDTQGQMALFDRLIADQDAAKIIDLSHRTFQKFFEVVQTIDFFEEARRCSIEPLILFVIAPDPKSAQAYSMLRQPIHCGVSDARSQSDRGSGDSRWRRVFKREHGSCSARCADTWLVTESPGRPAIIFVLPVLANDTRRSPRSFG